MNASDKASLLILETAGIRDNVVKVELMQYVFCGVRS